MKKFKLIALALSALFVAGLREQFATANAEGAAGTHPGAFTARADAALTATHLLLKRGTDTRHVAVCGASDYPVGTTKDQAEAAEDIIAVDPLGAGTVGSRIFRCTTAIAADADLYTAAAGKVTALSATPATYFKVGRSKKLAVQVGTNDYLIEADPCSPVETVVT